MTSGRRTLGTSALVLGLLVAGAPAGAIGDRVGEAVRVAGPPARAGAAMAADRNGNIVLFGGWSTDRGSLSDTWTWDGSAWTEQHPATHPTARCCFGLAYDAARRETVLFGGFASNYFGETWIWDGATWTKRHPPTSPGGAANFAMVYDAATEQVMAFLGEGLDFRPWAWDGSDWTQLPAQTSPAWRELEEFAYDDARGQVVMYGGYNCGEWCYRLFDDTWTWDGADWTRQGPAANPRQVSAAGSAYDGVRDQVVLFGGQLRANCGCLRDTWVWNGAEWRRAHPSDSPSARERPAMAWDALTQQVVLFGGRDWPQGIERDFGDTWTWDGVTWTEH
jgi:hypothetical protein